MSQQVYAVIDSANTVLASWSSGHDAGHPSVPARAEELMAQLRGAGQSPADWVYVEEPCDVGDVLDVDDDGCAAVRGSGCPRNWDLCEAGYWYDTVEACSAEEALEIARGNVDASNYEDVTQTDWIEVGVHCEETDESASDTVAIEPEEPDCSHEDGHDWQSPHAILGGLEENPGVWGHGGGVVIHAVCLHCGCERVTDTWAQNPTNGAQGLTSVRYEPGKYDSEVEALRESV